MALWSARRRGGPYIESEDLLHVLIRDDRGEFAAMSAEVFPEASCPIEIPGGSYRPFFAEDVARNLLRELHEDANFLNAEARSENREPVPQVELPMSHSLKRVLALVAQAHRTDTKSIEPLDLLAAILEDHDGRLAQLLRDQGISRQKVAKAINSESGV